MKTPYYIMVMLMALSISINAQDQTQALRYSQMFPIGSARFAAMGGAFGAVGGDLSVASTNPAGLGLFRSSEIVFTLSGQQMNTQANYLGETNSDVVTNGSIGNLGIASVRNYNKSEGLISTTFAYTFNALNNYNSSTIMRGINTNSSLLDNFAWFANNTNTLEPFYEGVAFESYALPFDTLTNTYWHDLEPNDAIGYAGYGQEQLRVVEKRGYTGEHAFSAAMNIGHKVYLGGTFGIHAVRYYEDIHHTETDVNSLQPDFESFRFAEYNSTRGYGYALKLGIIFKPIHMLRIGAAIHAPVSYYLTDEKYTEMNTTWNTSSGIPNGSAHYGVEAKEYTLKTPFRANLSTALVLGKLGMISAEYEYVDYASSDLDSPGYQFFDENYAISQDLKKVHNLKAGAEFRLNPLYLRAGLQYYMNPFADIRNGTDVMIYSAGLGIRVDQFYVDFSASLRTGSELYGLYHHTPEFEDGFEMSVNDYNAYNMMLTVGYKF